MTIVVNPINARLIAYPGGRGGEFLANLLNGHEQCVHSNMISWAKNRYLMRFDDDIEFAETPDHRQIFVVSHYPAHDHIPDANFIQVYNSPRYHPFYFLLFCLKTLSQRFYFEGGARCNILTDQQIAELAKTITDRNWHYYHEARAWQANGTASTIRKRVIDYLKKYGMGSYLARDQIEHSIIDLDQLYFGDTEAEYARICNTWKLTPIPGAVASIQEYHARNIALVEKYLKHDLNTLLNAYQPIAHELILDAVDRRHLDPED